MDRRGLERNGPDWNGADRSGRERQSPYARHKDFKKKLYTGVKMLKIKEDIFVDERVNPQHTSFIINPKRKLNQPKKIGEMGKVPAGEKKYSLIIEKQVMVEGVGKYIEKGVCVKQTRVINWVTLSRYIRKRDKQCLKCGSKKGLQADHFHPLCYQWINWFFKTSKIQTLCKKCHSQMPSMGGARGKNWKKYVYLK